MFRMTRLVARMTAAGLVMVAILLVAAPASALQGHWLIGLDALSSTIGRDENADVIVVDETAGGGAFQVGYLVTPTFLLRLYSGIADHPTNVTDLSVRFSGATVDAAYLFRSGARLRPYVFGGLGGFRLDSQQNELRYEAKGPGFAFGGGAHLELGSRVTLHGSLRIEGVNWNEVRASYTTPQGTVSIEQPVKDSGVATKLTIGIGIWI